MNPAASSLAGQISIDVDSFRQHFARHPFRVTHELTDHPLLRVERLLELSRDLPASKIEYNSGDLPVSVDPALTPLNGLSVAETIERIATCSSWMVLKYIETDPQYSALLDACVDTLARAAGREPSAFFKRAGFVFLSSPGSMTPMHIDPENNFLLQIRGSKTMHLLDRADREVVSEVGLERFAAGGHRNLQFQEAFRERTGVYELGPGDGLHVPVCAPHFVRNGPEVSVSLSITFHTAESDREHGVRMINSYLRRTGLSPDAPGSRADGWKYTLFRALRSVKRLMR